MFKKIIAVILCIVLFCSVGLIANAESGVVTTNILENESEIQPYYNYANTVTATLTNSSEKAKCSARVVGFESTTTKIKITMTLQKKTLLWWSEVNEWTTTVSSYQAYLSKTVAVDSGKHRVKVEAIVYSGSDSETISVYSSTYEF